MTKFVYANNVNTTLAASVTTSDTSITISSSANLPTLAAGQIMPITIVDAATGLLTEVMYVTSISGTTLTVTRAQEGTGAQAWAVGDYAFAAATAGEMQNSVQRDELQSGTFVYAADTSATANAITIALTPAITVLTAGQVVFFKAANTNTGATTIAVNGLTATNLFGAGSALAGGEIVSGGEYAAIYDGTQFNLIGSGSGAVPVGTASNPLHAIQKAQSSLSANPAGVLGSRAWNSTYTNSSTRTKFVSVAGSVGVTGAALTITVTPSGGSAATFVGTSDFTGGNASYISGAFAVVPPGATYSVGVTTGSVGTLYSWVEA